MCITVTDDGWRVGWSKGPETGLAGRTCADAVVLAAGSALLHAGNRLQLPWPNETPQLTALLRSP